MSDERTDADDERWQVVRDRGGDGEAAFFYAVRTTGVFCRPSCPSRRPRREHVSFFDTVDAAERAGFRACKRCRPDDDGTGDRAAMIERACRRLESDEPEPTLAVLAAGAGMSPFHFQKVFKAEVGVSPKGYAQAARVNRLKRSLAKGAPVGRAIYDAGFGASSRAYETAEARMGMTPGTWRAGAEGESIRYALSRCYLGRMIVAGTRRGICAIELGDDDEALVDGLRRRFPAAVLEPADGAFSEWLDIVVAFVDGAAGRLDLPLDIQGTAFQERVWTALRRIEPGTTVSYAALAAMIGKPSASRAVASACAANKIAIAIPCHRVTRTDGALSGYRWGPERKRAILDRERERATAGE